MATSDASWSTVSAQLPDAILSVADMLDSLVDALLAVLEVVRAVLDVVKALLVSLVDPITAIVDAALEEVTDLLDDIRQLGVYVSGDLDPRYPYDTLLGGYQAYERRMISRLVDRNDPTRPNFTSSTTVVAVFLYASFDSSAVAEALAFISQAKAFFGVPGRPQAFTAPTGLSVRYGADGASLGAFLSASDVLAAGTAPTQAQVRWQMSAPPSAGPVSWPLPAPAGFLVEVSTIPEGLTLACMSPAPRASVDASGVQHQSVGVVFDPDGRPFRLHGGLGVLDTTDLAWTSSGDTFTPPSNDGATRLYGFRTAADGVPIPVDALYVDGRHLLQRAFFVDAATLFGTNLVAPGQQFSVVLNAEDMPYGATFEDAGDGAVHVTPDDEPARDVFVRVSALTSDVTDGVAPKATSFSWTIGQTDVLAGLVSAPRLAVVEGLSSSAKSDPSSPVKVSFPSVQTAEYLDAVATALAVLVLSRADLVSQGSPKDADPPSYQLDTAGEPTGLEDLARYLIPQLVGPNTAKFFTRQGNSPVTFRGKLLAACRVLAARLLADTGPLSPVVERIVLASAEVTTASGAVSTLGDVRWSDLDPDVGVEETILGSLDLTTSVGVDVSAGVAPNPVCVGVDAAVAEFRLGGLGVSLTRKPGFLVNAKFDVGGMGTGSADWSPVIYDTSGSSVRFCRNVFLANPSILTAAASVLGVAAATSTRTKVPGEGAWLARRLFPQGLPPVDAALSEVFGFLQSIRSGTEGVADAVEAYVSFVESRILELEALLQRIDALLAVMSAIQVPAASGLVVVADGTDGVLQALVSSDDKPQDSALTTSRINSAGEVEKSGAYGAGVVLLAGGLPTTLLDLFQAMFVEG